MLLLMICESGVAKISAANLTNFGRSLLKPTAFWNLLVQEAF